MDKTLKNGVKYDWNESPQPQMVGFWNLVGTDIAPVSKKTAVKYKKIFKVRCLGLIKSSSREMVLVKYI